MSIFVVLTCVAVMATNVNSAPSSSSASFNNPVASANVLVDDFLARIQHKLDEKFEPIILPDKGFEFEKKILLVTVKGEAKLTNGWLAGFSTLHRNGDAQLSTSPGTRILKAPLGVSNLAGHYRGRVKFMNFGPTIEVDIKLGQVNFQESKANRAVLKRPLKLQTTTGLDGCR